MSAHILVVDDEPDVESLISRRFRREVRSGKMSFSFARDGVEALELIRQPENNYDVLLCDINMPRMDGLTLLDRIQRDVPLLKAVMVSAYGDFKNIRAAMNAGAFDFVTKPIDFEDLLVTIDKTLRELNTLRNAFEKRIEAEAARANLARYFSPNIVDRLAARENTFGDVRSQDVAVMFADIVDFTALTETMPPEQVMLLLREFHARIEEAVFKHDGLMEKYIGDAALAIFGAPDLGAQDASNALSCAKAIFETVDDLSRQRVARGDDAIRIGIGLNYGKAVMGDIGSERNAAFAVVGDTVNTASRIQDLTRTLGCDLAASDTFVSAIRGEQNSGNAELLLDDFERHGPVEVKGRRERITVWTASMPLR